MEFSEEKLQFIRHRDEQYAGVTARTFRDYCLGLGLDQTDFKGKKVLDIGSGVPDNFSQGVKQFGGHVVSISPALVNEYERGRVKSSQDEGKNSLAARSQELPLKEESFDLVVSYWAVPAYLPRTNETEGYDRDLYEQEAGLSINEMLRVLKPAGEIRLAPIGIRLHGDPGDEGLIVDALGQKTKDELISAGYSLAIERVDQGSPVLKIKKSGK
jgi:ubiquinone/menaquinone biosynthesis C-methylase UbiE